MHPDHTSLFKPIEPPSISWTRWAVSLAVHFAAIIAIIAVPVAVHQAIQPERNSVRLVDPRIPPPVKIQAPKIKFRTVEVKKVPLPVEKPKLEARKIEPPKVQPPKIEPPKIEPPKIEAARAPEPKFDIPVPAAPPRPVVKTDVFASNAPAPEGPKPVSRDVKLGGFGDPNGVPASATSSGKGLTVAKLGAFDLPAGNGQGGAMGSGKVVASAGFGSAGSGGTGSGTGAPHGAVRAAGFSDYQPNPAAPRIIKASVPAETPVEILFKPKPVYTAAAREKKLEGEVQLEVVFSATGQIRVVKVVRGLGLGLDESACAAAAQIRFRPGTRDGNPVDMKAIVHIVFELS